MITNEVGLLELECMRVRQIRTNERHRYFGISRTLPLLVENKRENRKIAITTAGVECCSQSLIIPEEYQASIVFVTEDYGRRNGYLPSTRNQRSEGIETHISDENV